MILNFNNLKSGYEELRKKYSKYPLPDFKKFNKIFKIETICNDNETEWLSAKLRIHVFGKISFPIDMITGLFLNPSFEGSLISEIIKKNQQDAIEIAKELTQFKFTFIQGDFLNSEDYDIKCVSEYCARVEEIEKKIAALFEDVKGLNISQNKNYGGYFG